MSVGRPSTWLTWCAGLIPQGAAVLDWASGTGRHAIYLAELGARVTAADRDLAALEQLRAAATERGLPIDLLQTDLERDDAITATYDAVLVFNYLDRTRLPRVQRVVRPGGLLICETFLTWQQGLGWGPTDEAHMLRIGELAELVAPMQLLFSREVLETIGDRVRAVASVVARQPEIT